MVTHRIPRRARMVLALSAGVLALSAGVLARAVRPLRVYLVGRGMVPIPGGTFLMGSTIGDVSPVGDLVPDAPHAVTVRPFRIDRTEVTTWRYCACVRAGACDLSRYVNFDPCPWLPVRLNEHPIVLVSHAQAATYCRWVGARLPTEAEWEFAARGTDGRTYPWGNQPPDATRENACGAECVAAMARLHIEARALYPGNDGFVDTAPVGSFPAGASPSGVLDLLGNVSEWTADPDAAQAAAGVVGPDLVYAIRGSNFTHLYDPERAGAAHRQWAEADASDTYVGFRCARDR